LAISSTLQYVSICHGDSLYAGGSWQTTAGTYYDVLTNSFGCDSTVVTVLSLKLNSSFTQAVSVCEGDSYYAGGADQTVSGTYYDTLVNFLGCDSVLTTNLTVLATAAFSQPVSICEGQSFYAGGDWQTSSGIYFDTLTAANGCDSVLTTQLSVLAALVASQNISICEGESFYAGGADQTSPGIYVDTLLSSFGCDSLLTTYLAVNPPSTFVQWIDLCEGESYLAGGALQTLSGTYYDTLINAVGCDSLRTTHLEVNPHSFFTQNVSICEGQSYFAGGANQTQSGTYTDLFVNAQGCDSTLTTLLNVLPVLTFSQTVSICEGDSFFAGGADQTLPGSYVDTLTSAFGCDSILTTHLSTLPVSSAAISVTICEGDSYFAGGANQTQSGIYSDVFINSAGCDSVLTTTLTVLPASFTTLGVSICEGDSSFAGGGWQTQTGIYSDTFANSLGCDSVITTNLTVYPASLLVLDVFICNGDSFFAGGSYQSQSGIYFDTLSNSLGCDSIVTTQLGLLPVYFTPVNVVICEGDSFYAGGSFQTQAGVYVDSLTAATGCDSIVATTLAVLVPVQQEIFPSLCRGEAIFAGGALQTEPGVYTDTLVSTFGCDSILITMLTVLDTPAVNLGADTSFCRGESIVLNAGSGNAEYLWQDQSTGETLVTGQEGIYWVKVTNTLGCSAADTLLVNEVYELPENFLATDTIICGNLPLLIDVPGYQTYAWFDGDSTSLKVFVSEGNFSLEVEDENGCSASESIAITDVCTEDLLMPNAFTPNGDGVNDELLPVIIHFMTDYHLKIFNRWGMLVFQSLNQQTGWDGFSNGTRGEMGSYVWVIDYTLEGGEQKSARGNVTLLR
jgi:gliding motility-associated-like protein